MNRSSDSRTGKANSNSLRTSRPVLFPQNQSGETNLQWIAILTLLALGWFLSLLWSQIEPEAQKKKSVAKPPQVSKSSARTGTAKGSSDSSASPLDSLSEAEQLIFDDIFELFLLCQWNSAMDASTAHRVARARTDLQNLLDSLGPEHVAMLTGILEEEPDFINRRFLLKALGKIGSKEALNSLLEHYYWANSEGKESEVKHTIESLSLANNDASFDILRDFSLSEEDEIHRYRFVEALTQHSRSEDARDVYGALLEDPSHFRVRQRAAYGFKVSGKKVDAQTVESALLVEKNPYVRQSYLGALGGIRDVNSIPMVQKILSEDNDISTRISAVRALLRIDGANAIQALLVARNTGDSSDRVNQEIVTALQQLGIDD